MGVSLGGRGVSRGGDVMKWEGKEDARCYGMVSFK